MKRFLLSLPILAIAFMACQQTSFNQPKPVAAFEVTFDLDGKTAQVNASRVQPLGSLTPTQLSFTAPSSIGYLADATRNVNYLSATFQVNNLTGGAFEDLTLVAQYKTGNASDTALKAIVDFNGVPLTPTQLEFFARAVQPVNMPSSISPNFVVNDNVADVQYFNETELTSLESAATTSNELQAGEYLFPYGFIARSSSTSRSIGAGNNAGTVTVAMKLPNNNEPSSGSPRRFTMTFLAFDEPLGTGVKRMTESYEERRGTSSAATRGTGFSIPSTNIARNTVTSVASSVLVPGVRTAGSQTNLKRMLGERAWQFGTSGVESPRGVTVDSSGNAYITGYTEGTLAGNTSAGSYDAFIAKYDLSGNQIWVKQFGTSLFDVSSGVAVDSSSNAYITGYTLGTFAGNTSAGGNDVFVAKYDSSGNQIWVKQFGTTSSDFGNGIAVDSSGNTYITGGTSDTFSGNTNAGNYDVFVAKYDSSGNQVWVKQFGTSSSDFGSGIAVDSSGNAYIAGQTNGTFAGNTNAGSADMFIAKYDSSGNQVWVKQFGTSSGDFGSGIAVDASGNTYTTGYTEGALAGNISAGSADMFIAKYDTSGNQVWVKQFGTSSSDFGSGIVVDSSGNAYIAGQTNGTFAGNTNAGGNDAFLVRFDLLGNTYY
jgi:hypothetical protein